MLKLLRNYNSLTSMNPAYALGGMLPGRADLMALRHVNKICACPGSFRSFPFV